MKLFGDFEAVWFPEENLIFVTKNKYLYYIYNPKYQQWKKYRNAKNDCITVTNYPDVSKEDIVNAMQGQWPKKETDFIRLCDSSQLWIRDMLALLEEDYMNYMSDYSIYHAVYSFLLESDICYKSFSEVKKLLNDAATLNRDKEQVLEQIRHISFTIIGRDIFKEEIGIVDGHNSSSYFYIMPVRVIDYSNTNDIDNVAEMKSAEISIEEDDVNQYLALFLYKHFNNELEANKKRVDDHWIDDDGNEQILSVRGFEWNLTHNFFTFDSITEILKDINDTIDALSSGKVNEFMVKLREGQIKEDNTKVELILDFYRRFTYRMEYMIKVGKEKGFDLISFMGP